jgi:REP element-mobilizing transposase RayT
VTPKYDPHKHHRRSIRLKGYDYSQEGAYFITICTRHMICLFGQVENDRMILADAGKMINEQWIALADRFPNSRLGEYITMPNHFHAILFITGVGVPLVGTQNGGATLGQMIGAFKSITTGKYINGVNRSGWPPFDGKLWQHNYYEHVIRNEASLLKISKYIHTNPARWKDDTYYQ